MGSAFIKTQTHRGVDLTGIYVEGNNVMASSDPPRAIFDTGVSCIYAAPLFEEGRQRGTDFCAELLFTPFYG